MYLHCRKTKEILTNSLLIKESTLHSSSSKTPVGIICKAPLPEISGDKGTKETMESAQLQNEHLIKSHNSSTTPQSKKIYIDLPKYPKSPLYSSNVSKPPAPILKFGDKNEIGRKGVMLTWNITCKIPNNIVEYQLFAFRQISHGGSSSFGWMKVDNIKAKPLPMKCYLTHFRENTNYFFIVRALDNHKRMGNFSKPLGINLKKLDPSLKTPLAIVCDAPSPDEIGDKDKEAIIGFTLSQDEDTQGVINEVISRPRIYDKEEGGTLIMSGYKCQGSSNVSARPSITMESAQLQNEHLIKSHNSSTTPQSKNIYIDLPKYPKSPLYSSNVSKPPAPILKFVDKNEIGRKGVMLTWNITCKIPNNIVEYQLFAFRQISHGVSSSFGWMKVDNIKAKPLPMKCYLTHFRENTNYFFIVRALDNHKRMGNFSKPLGINLKKLDPSLKTPLAIVCDAPSPDEIGDKDKEAIIGFTLSQDEDTQGVINEVISRPRIYDKEEGGTLIIDISDSK